MTVATVYDYTFIYESVCHTVVQNLNHDGQKSNIFLFFFPEIYVKYSMDISVYLSV